MDIASVSVNPPPQPLVPAHFGVLKKINRASAHEFSGRDYRF